MKISCIIPTCDRAEYLTAALASVFAQTLQPDEIIIADNGKEPAVVPKEFAARVRVLQLPPYSGAARARNFGARQAKNGVLAFLDDDDLWGKEYLARAATALAEGAECAISRLDALFGEEIRAYKTVSGNLTIPDLLHHNPGITGSNIVIRKEALLRVGGFDESLPTSEDKSLAIELIRARVRIRTIPESQAIQRMYEGPARSHLADPSHMAEGVAKFTAKYRALMDPQTYFFNRWKLFRARAEAGGTFSSAVSIIYALLYRLARAASRLRPPTVYTRPSKTFLLGRAARVVSSVRGEIGLDAAAEDCKTRPLFRTNRYVGLDINEKALRLGLSRYTVDASGVLADITDLSALPSRSVDLILSTHTLDHLSSEGKQKAIAEFIRLLAPGGTLVCHLAVGKDAEIMEKRLRDTMAKLAIHYSRNPISRWYESMFERGGFLGFHPLASRHPFRALSYLISLAEFLTCRSKTLNRSVLFVAQARAGGARRPFDLSRIPQRDGIYDSLTSSADMR